MKKRAFAILLCIAVLAACAAGCGGDPKSSTAASPETPAQSETPAETTPDEAAPQTSALEDSAAPAPEPAHTISYPVGDGETYSVAIVMDGNLLDYVPGGDPAEAAGMRIMQDKTGINFDYTVFAMLSDNMTLMISSGEWTDVIVKIDESYTSGVSGALDDDVILDLAPYIDEYAPDYAAFLASDDTYSKNTFDDAGRLGAFYDFRIPSALGNVIRKDWLDEAGITEIPETYDEFETAALAVLGKHPELDSCIATGSSWIAQGYESELEYGYGIDTINNKFFVNEDGNVDYAWTTDNARAYLEMIARWVDKGILSKDDMLTGDAMSFGNRIYQGGALLKHDNTDAFGPDKLSLAEDESFELAPAYELTQEKGDAIRFSGAVTVMTGWSITTTCPNPELLIQACNWIYTDEGTLALNFGKEDESYTVDADGTYHYTDLVLNNPDGLPLFFATSVYTAFEMPKIGMPEANTAKLSNQQQMDAQEFWNSQARGDGGVLYGDLNAQELEITSGYSDINTLVQEKAMSFAVGDLPINDENWEAFVQQVESMGIDEITQCYQAAHERYLAR